MTEENEIPTEIKFQLDAIKWFQTRGYMHEMTCGNDSKHPHLKGRINAERVVELYCEKCDYIQNYIPEPVLERYKYHLRNFTVILNELKEKLNSLNVYYDDIEQLCKELQHKRDSDVSQAIFSAIND